MGALHAIDLALFRFINLRLQNPYFDAAAPFLSWTPLFVPLVLAAAALVLWRGGWKGRLFVAMLALALLIGDSVICNTLKRSLARNRPFIEMPEARVLVGKTESGSMPSSHSANWFAAATLAWLYFGRRGLWLAIPAAVVAVSRIYAGVHYPSDVVAGVAIGILTALGIVAGTNQLWQWAGRKWFPIWWTNRPRLWTRGRPPDVAAVAEAAASNVSLDAHWARFGQLTILAMLVWRWSFAAGSHFELSEDEAYQWLWSKHLALSYYSKPPLIAYAQFLGTALWGDNQFGVRFFSPLFAALVAWMSFRFVRAETNARVATALVWILMAMPLLVVGSTLMTIDAPSVLFWTAAMIAGWKAVRRDSTADWAWAGVWLGLGFLSKYVALVQLLCFGLWLAAWPGGRRHWRRPGPYLALAIAALSTFPVLIWNAQHHWVTVAHLVNRGGLDEPWDPTLRFVRDFWLAEFGLLNPVFFPAMLLTACLFWKRRTTAMAYLFWMGAPLFVGYALLAFRSRVQPNWIAPAVTPLAMLMALYWDARRDRTRLVRTGLAAGLTIGLSAFVFLHSPHLTEKVAGAALSARKNPFARVLGWKALAEEVSAARAELLKEGPPVFVIGEHYGVTSLLTFYWPEAKARAGRDPLVYCELSERAGNQFYFWDGYQGKIGENALYVQRHSSENGVPQSLQRQFASVTDLGVRDILYRGRVLHRFRFFACRNFRGK